VADVHDPGEDKSGWLERQASGRALDAAAQSIGLPDGAALVRAARGRDAAAIDALTPAMQALGTALAGAVTLLAPQAVILAGGVAASVDVLQPLILVALRKQLPPHLRDIDIRPGQFGPKAGLVGAAFAGAYGTNWRNGHG
jgi:glucokinase